jgi:hypothetical protein
MFNQMRHVLTLFRTMQNAIFYYGIRAIATRFAAVCLERPQCPRGDQPESEPI